MDNKALDPSSSEPENPGKELAPDSRDAMAGLGSTHVAGGTSSVDTENAGEPLPPAEDQPSRQRTLSQLGDYVLLKKLGAGAMGVVYKARQLSANRSVALKVLFKHIADNHKLVERFHREARVSADLEHPNIVRGLGVGEEYGWHYFAMEYCRGASLQKWLARLGKLSLGDSLHIALCCDNILITRKGEVKVADFGMVKQLDEDMSLTQTGHAVGTPWYMPLEQAKNAKDTDGRCDIYALGCVFYACLTGHPPFSGPTLVDVICAKEIGTFPPARQFSNEVSERVELILLKMMAKLPKYRYPTCARLITDLESLGLANSTLAFLQAVTPQSGTSAAPTEVIPAGMSSITTPLPDKAPSHGIWFVRYKRPNGQQVVQKLTTMQVLRLLESPHFDSGAMASHNQYDGFRALATYKEFEKLALGRSTRSGADKQTFRSRKLYEQIVEEQTQREKPAAKPVTTLRYWSGILLRIAIVMAIVGALYVGVLLVLATAKTLFG
jgi:serine/threonine protein kinase